MINELKQQIKNLNPGDRIRVLNPDVIDARGFDAPGADSWHLVTRIETRDFPFCEIQRIYCADGRIVSRARGKERGAQWEKTMVIEIEPAQTFVIPKGVGRDGHYHYAVKSRTNPNASYDVKESELGLSCDCKGFFYKRNCAHIQQTSRFCRSLVTETSAAKI